MSLIYYNGLPLSGSFTSLGRFAFRVVVSQLLRINLACLLFRYIVFKVLSLSRDPRSPLVSRDSFDSIPPSLRFVNPYFLFFVKIFFGSCDPLFGGSGKYFTILN